MNDFLNLYPHSSQAFSSFVLTIHVVHEEKEVDWQKFAIEVEQKLQTLGKTYYLKEDLRKI